MLIHSLFPGLIHMLFGHNTSRRYESSFQAPSLPLLHWIVFPQHYMRFMYLVVMLMFLEVNSKEIQKSL